MSHCTGTIFLFLSTLSSAGGSSYAQPIHKEWELHFPPWGCTSTYLDSVLMVKNKLRFRSSIYRTSRIAMGMIPFLGTQFENHWPRQHGQMMHMLRFVVQLLGRVQLFWDPMDCSPSGSSIYEDSPGKTTGVGDHALLQGIFPIQVSNPGLPHCRRILYCLSHQGSPEKKKKKLGMYIEISLFDILVI